MSKIFENTETISNEKELLFYETLTNILNDDNITSELITTLNARIKPISIEIQQLFSQCPSNENIFPIEFHTWIIKQIKPYLNYINLQSNSIIPTSSSTSSSSSSNNNRSFSSLLSSSTSSFTSINKNNSSSSSNSNLHGGINNIGGIPITVKQKQKKRVTPKIIPVAIDSSTESVLVSNGNISSLSDSTGLINRDNINNTAVASMPINRNNVNFNQMPNSNNLSVLNPSLISCSNEIKKSLPIPTPIRNNELYEVIINQGDKAHINNTKAFIEPETTSPLSPSSLSPIIDASTNKPANPAYVNNIHRMAEVYSCLINNQYISIATALPVLTTLACLQLPQGDVTIKILKPEKFISILIKDTNLYEFVTKTIQLILPIIKSLGSSIAKGFSDSDLIKRLNPSISKELTAYIEDSQGSNEDAEESKFFIPDTFIRPFREDIDSRNEYKSPIEHSIYNEREHCYDDFSNLFHQFQDINKIVDIDGLKMAEFWKSSLSIAKQKIFVIRDCNYAWFAEIFKQMLLFHGLNVSSNTSNQKSSMY
jgi:hypothetical protein